MYHVTLKRVGLPGHAKSVHKFALLRYNLLWFWKDRKVWELKNEAWESDLLQIKVPWILWIVLTVLLVPVYRSDTVVVFVVVIYGVYVVYVVVVYVVFIVSITITAMLLPLLSGIVVSHSHQYWSNIQTSCTYGASISSWREDNCCSLHMLEVKTLSLEVDVHYSQRDDQHMWEEKRQWVSSDTNKTLYTLASPSNSVAQNSLSSQVLVNLWSLKWRLLELFRYCSLFIAPNFAVDVVVVWLCVRLSTVMFCLDTFADMRTSRRHSDFDEPGLQTDLDNTNEWSHTWQIQLDITKRKILILGRWNPHTRYVYIKERGFGKIREQREIYELDLYLISIRESEETRNKSNRPAGNTVERSHRWSSCDFTQMLCRSGPHISEQFSCVGGGAKEKR